MKQSKRRIKALLEYYMQMEAYIIVEEDTEYPTDFVMRLSDITPKLRITLSCGDSLDACDAWFVEDTTSGASIFIPTKSKYFFKGRVNEFIWKISPSTDIF